APAFSLIVQGSSEAMVTEDCIPRILLHCRENGAGNGKEAQPGFLGIRDETGRVFPVRTDGDCRTRIANASELCLIDLLPDIRDAGITAIALDARYRPPSYIGKMVRLYREAIEIAGNDPGKAREAGLKHQKDQVKEIALGGITAGHFIRGLKE
ncbi:MAG: U32 family peptidase, partial [Methanoregula sp.]|nr:U32 family peptidase [Methanoregula sp.]